MRLLYNFLRRFVRCQHARPDLGARMRLAISRSRNIGDWTNGPRASRRSQLVGGSGLGLEGGEGLGSAEFQPRRASWGGALALTQEGRSHLSEASAKRGSCGAFGHGPGEGICGHQPSGMRGALTRIAISGVGGRGFCCQGSGDRTCVHVGVRPILKAEFPGSPESSVTQAYVSPSRPKISMLHGLELI